MGQVCPASPVHDQAAHSISSSGDTVSAEEHARREEGATGSNGTVVVQEKRLGKTARRGGEPQEPDSLAPKVRASEGNVFLFCCVFNSPAQLFDAVNRHDLVRVNELLAEHAEIKSEGDVSGALTSRCRQAHSVWWQGSGDGLDVNWAEQKMGETAYVPW